MIRAAKLTETTPYSLTKDMQINYVADYFPYGKVLRIYVNGQEERYLTTQHERDVETGLDYRGARYYDCDVARFLSLDPLATKFPGWSTYSYSFDNPIIFTDPTGKEPEMPSMHDSDGEPDKKKAKPRSAATGSAGAVSGSLENLSKSEDKSKLKPSQPETNVEVVLGSGSVQQGGLGVELSISRVVEGKDENRTVVISGENFQKLGSSTSTTMGTFSHDSDGTATYGNGYIGVGFSIEPPALPPSGHPLSHVG